MQFEDTPTSVRDHDWLINRFDMLLKGYFADVKLGYPIVVTYGLRARRRFGSISERNKHSIIRLNALFSHPDVPEKIIDATLAHEMVHYVHGFCSGLPRQVKYPHADHAIEKELKKRGLLEMYEESDVWLKTNWNVFYETHCKDLKEVKSARAATHCMLWQRWLDMPNMRDIKHLNCKIEHILTRFPSGNVPNIEWYPASARQQATTYYHPQTQTIHVHSALANPKVPEYVFDFELGYWIARLKLGPSWDKIRPALLTMMSETDMNLAISWRTRTWPNYRRQVLKAVTGYERSK